MQGRLAEANALRPLCGRRAPGASLVRFVAELVALDVADLEESMEGPHVHIRRSKTDQEGAGDFVSTALASAP